MVLMCVDARCCALLCVVCGAWCAARGVWCVVCVVCCVCVLCVVCCVCLHVSTPFIVCDMYTCCGEPRHVTIKATKLHSSQQLSPARHRGEL